MQLIYYCDGGVYCHGRSNSFAYGSYRVHCGAQKYFQWDDINDSFAAQSRILRILLNNIVFALENGILPTKNLTIQIFGDCKSAIKMIDQDELSEIIRGEFGVTLNIAYRPRKYIEQELGH